MTSKVSFSVTLAFWFLWIQVDTIASQYQTYRPAFYSRLGYSQPVPHTSPATCQTSPCYYTLYYPQSAASSSSTNAASPCSTTSSVIAPQPYGSSPLLSPLAPPPQPAPQPLPFAQPSTTLPRPLYFPPQTSTQSLPTQTPSVYPQQVLCGSRNSIPVPTNVGFSFNLTNSVPDPQSHLSSAIFQIISPYFRHLNLNTGKMLPPPPMPDTKVDSDFLNKYISGRENNRIALLLRSLQLLDDPFSIPHSTGSDVEITNAVLAVPVESYGVLVAGTSNANNENIQLETESIAKTESPSADLNKENEKKNTAAENDSSEKSTGTHPAGISENETNLKISESFGQIAKEEEYEINMQQSNEDMTPKISELISPTSSNDDDKENINELDTETTKDMKINTSEHLGAFANQEMNKKASDNNQLNENKNPKEITDREPVSPSSNLFNKQSVNENTNSVEKLEEVSSDQSRTHEEEIKIKKIGRQRKKNGKKGQEHKGSANKITKKHQKVEQEKTITDINNDEGESDTKISESRTAAIQKYDFETAESLGEFAKSENNGEMESDAKSTENTNTAENLGNIGSEESWAEGKEDANSGKDNTYFEEETQIKKHSTTEQYTNKVEVHRQMTDSKHKITENDRQISQSRVISPQEDDINDAESLGDFAKEENNEESHKQLTQTTSDTEIASKSKSDTNDEDDEEDIKNSEQLGNVASEESWTMDKKNSKIETEQISENIKDKQNLSDLDQKSTENEAHKSQSQETELKAAESLGEFAIEKSNEKSYKQSTQNSNTEENTEIRKSDANDKSKEEDIKTAEEFGKVDTEEPWKEDHEVTSISEVNKQSEEKANTNKDITIETTEPNPEKDKGMQEIVASNQNTGENDASQSQEDELKAAENLGEIAKEENNEESYKQSTQNENAQENSDMASIDKSDVSDQSKEDIKTAEQLGNIAPEESWSNNNAAEQTQTVDLTPKAAEDSEKLSDKEVEPTAKANILTAPGDERQGNP